MNVHASGHINFRPFLRGVKERWRQYIFAVLCLVSVLGGLYWYQKSKPIQVPATSFYPGSVDVYVSDPAAVVTITVRVDANLNGNNAHASISISIRPPHPNDVVRWLVMAGVDQSHAEGATVPPIYINGYPREHLAPSAVWKGSTSPQFTPDPITGSSIIVGSYESDADYRFYSNGSFKAVPPSIEFGSSPGQLAFMLESSVANGLSPKSHRSQALVDYADGRPGPIDKVVPGAITKEAFYVPTSLTDVAQLGVESHPYDSFLDYQILQADPTAGLFDPSLNTLTWRADNGLDVIETAVSGSAEDARSNESFFAGIALAVAAAAGIAFLQERPRKWEPVGQEQEAVEQPPSTTSSSNSSE